MTSFLRRVILLRAISTVELNEQLAQSDTFNRTLPSPLTLSTISLLVRVAIPQMRTRAFLTIKSPRALSHHNSTILLY